MDFLVLTKTGGILGPLASVFGFIINYIYKFLDLIGIPNIALVIILFTLIVNLILLPLTYKQQKTSKMMTVMNPELMKIQEKYKDKKDEVSMRRMQAETSAVYQKYGTSPMGGCLYMIIQLPILFALYQVIYRVPAYVQPINDMYMSIADPISKIAGGGDIISSMITELKLNVVNFDFSSKASIIDFLAALRSTDWTMLTERMGSAAVTNAVNTVVPTITRVNSIFGVLNMADLPLTNGWWPGVLIPILSGASQFASTKIAMASNPEQQEASKDNPMSGSMKMMNYIMPLFSVFICFSFNIGIGVYWIANSVVRTVIMVLLNKIIDRKGVDEILKENREKAKKKAEKRGESPANFEEYAKMSTKHYEETQQKRRSIKEIANTSTLTADEIAQQKKNKNNAGKKQSGANQQQKEPASDQQQKGSVSDKDSDQQKNEPVSSGTKNETSSAPSSEKKKESSSERKGLFGKNKEDEPKNIASIAHMLDNSKKK